MKNPVYEAGFKDGSWSGYSLAKTEMADELKRLREIEHRTWHLLDDSMDEDGTLKIDMENNTDLEKLYELLPDAHPEIKEQAK